MTLTPTGRATFDLIAAARPAQDAVGVRLESTWRISERLGLFGATGVEWIKGKPDPFAGLGLRFQLP